MLDIDRFHAKSALVGGDIGRGQRAKARAAEADLEAALLHEEVIAVVVVEAAEEAAIAAAVVAEVTVAAEEAVAAIAAADDVKLFTTSQPTASTAHPRRQSGQLKLTTYHHGAAGKI